MFRKLLTIAALCASSFTFAADQTALPVTGGVVTGGVFLRAAGKLFLANGDEFFVSTIRPKEVVAALDDAAITDIMSNLGGPLDRFGIGHVGGAKISMTLNQAHLDAVELLRTVDSIAEEGKLTPADLEAVKKDIASDSVKHYDDLKNGMKKRDILVIKYAEDKDVKAALEDFKKYKVGVTEIEFAGTLRRASGMVSKVVLTALFAAPAASNLVHAAQFALSSSNPSDKTWLTQEASQKQGYTASALTWIFDTSDALYFKLNPSK